MIVTGSFTRRAVLVALASLALASASCRSKDDEPEVVAAAGSARDKPVDRLAPGELAPGEHEAFGLVLPRGMKIEGKFEKTVYAGGQLPPEDVANYIRKRVRVRFVEMGAAATIFPRVAIKGAPPDRVYTIEVARRPGGTKLTVRDETPPPKPPLQMSEKQLMDRAGLTPDGKVKNLDQLE